MKPIFRNLLVVLAALVIASAAFAQEDVAGSKDYPGLSRIPGYYILEYSETGFDSFTFQVKEGNKDKQETIEGHLYKIRYDFGGGDASQLPASAMQILRNYQNAARAAGGKIVFEAGGGDDRTTTVHFVKGDKETWLEVHALSSADKVIFLNIIEKQALKQEVTMDAATMASGLSDSGRIAVAGILFDTGKSELMSESEPALVEVAKLLTENPTLRVYVVGHTDMMADLNANLKLSQARAQSVVTALVSKHGISAARLIPFGNGPYAPVASNKTDEGRAKNRRVELVEIATK